MFLQFIILVFQVVCFQFGSSEIFFQEDFNDRSWRDRWVIPEARFFRDKPYGSFEWEAGKWYADYKDRGMFTTEDDKYYLISTKIPTFSNKDRILVVQHTVKFEKFFPPKDRVCGSGFLKLYPPGFDPKKIDGDSPFLLKYGPDMCRSATEATIFHKGKYYDHRPRLELLDKNIFMYIPDIPIHKDAFTHLYTLVFFPNSTFTKYIDGKVIEHGDMSDEWRLTAPPLIWPKDDRPDDWDEREFIIDPDQKKPDDWVEEEFIVDPYASKPEDWDEAADGEWDAPLIRNPAYKGAWEPTKLIPNPNFKGKWIRERIPNPEYKFVPDAYLLGDIGGVGIDIWQEDSGTLIDDILITDELDYALETGLAKWQKKYDAEYKIFEDECKKRQKERELELKKIEDSKKKQKPKKRRNDEL